MRAPRRRDGLCGFDIETTGVDVETARIVTAAVVKLGKTGSSDRTSPVESLTTYLINPGVDIPKEASDVHGVTTEIAGIHGAPPRDALEDLAGRLAGELCRGSLIVAFNLAYDWTILDRELRRNGLRAMAERVESPGVLYNLVDPFVIDKAVDKYRRGSRKLKDVCDHYGISEITDWHSAEADAKAAVLLAERLFEKFPQIRSLEMKDSGKPLFNAQKTWRKEQAESLQAYFRNPAKSGTKHNPTAVVNGDWPLQFPEPQQDTEVGQ